MILCTQLKLLVIAVCLSGIVESLHLRHVCAEFGIANQSPNFTPRSEIEAMTSQSRHGYRRRRKLLELDEILREQCNLSLDQFWAKLRQTTPHKQRASNLNVMPYSAVGVVLSGGAGQIRGACTGQFYGNSRLLLTAAHCISECGRDGLALRDAIQFQQQYGGATHGPNKPTAVYMYRDFCRNSGRVDRLVPYDYAFLCMEDRSQGGAHLKIDHGSADVYTSNDVEAMGYQMGHWSTNFASRLYGVKSKSVCQQETCIMRSPFTTMSSGGAWVKHQWNKYMQTWEFAAVGINSQTQDSKFPRVVWSPPLHSDAFRTLYSEAVWSCMLKQSQRRNILSPDLHLFIA